MYIGGIWRVLLFDSSWMIPWHLRWICKTRDFFVLEVRLSKEEFAIEYGEQAIRCVH